MKPTLDFLEPSEGAVISVGQEIPIVLRGFAPHDVIGSAEVKADETVLGTAVYCCPLCPCARPLPGMALILQLPVPWEDRPPARSWQGWTNASRGTHRLTAVGLGENGTDVQATPVTIQVLDLRLRIHRQPGGGYQLVIPDGSMTEGGWNVEASGDLKTWTLIGTFAPGNVAAFFQVAPEAAEKERLFFRSVQVRPPR